MNLIKKKIIAHNVLTILRNAWYIWKIPGVIIYLLSFSSIMTWTKQSSLQMWRLFIRILCWPFPLMCKHYAAKQLTTVHWLEENQTIWTGYLLQTVPSLFCRSTTINFHIIIVFPFLTSTGSTLKDSLGQRAK